MGRKVKQTSSTCPGQLCRPSQMIIEKRCDVIDGFVARVDTEEQLVIQSDERSQSSHCETCNALQDIPKSMIYFPLLSLINDGVTWIDVRVGREENALCGFCDLVNGVEDMIDGRWNLVWRSETKRGWNVFV